MLKQEFNAWWNDDDLTYENPFKEETPAFWAWEGWVAGVKAEREGCAEAAGIALLGADRALTERVLKTIRARSNE